MKISEMTFEEIVSFIKERKITWNNFILGYKMPEQIQFAIRDTSGGTPGTLIKTDFATGTAPLGIARGDFNGADRTLAQLLSARQADPGVERRIGRARPLVEHQPARSRRADQTAYGEHRLRRPRRHRIHISHRAAILIYRMLLHSHAQQCKNPLM